MDEKLLKKLSKWCKFSKAVVSVTDLLNILRRIEKKTKGPKIVVFYGEEVFSSDFVKEVSELRAGFIAKSVLAGILGSVIVECMREPDRLKYHVQMYVDVTEDSKPDLIGFIRHLFEWYEPYTVSFGMEDEFTSSVYRRISDGKGLRYEDTAYHATLDDIDEWSVKRLRNRQETFPISFLRFCEI